MSTTHIAGIDPGLRDTGVVCMTFDPEIKLVSVRTLVVHGIDVQTTTLEVGDWLAGIGSPDIFIEQYVPRPGMRTSPEMQALERALVSKLKRAELVRNTGVKQIIPQELMQLLKVWTFSTPTNHDDLRSAARIGLYGMTKRPGLNGVLADVVQSVLDADPWMVDVQKGEVRGAP